MAVTILDLAEFRLGKDAERLTGADLEEAGLYMFGGCQICNASLAAYNACPSKSGYWKCASGCIGDDGWDSVDEANRAIFGEADALLREQNRADLEAQVARLRRIEEAARDTERELHDWLDGRPQHIHELVAHLLASLRSALEGRKE